MEKSVFLLSLFFCLGASSREARLPFSMQVKERTENLPTYVAPHLANLYNANPNFKVGWGIDSPTGLVNIDNEVWVIFNSGNQYGTQVKVARFKGPDFEHTVRQEDGIIEVEKGVSTHFCGGLWYDADTGTLYALIHCEYKNNISPPAGWSRKKVRLATSPDKGRTWRLVGDILTDGLPGDEDWLKYSGSYFQAGPGDFDFYADVRGGYFYIFTCNAYAPKNGRMNNFLWFNEVARCAISDKMAPGKWWKFCHGAWQEPGLGGKSSKVSMDTYGIYGRVIYSTFLKKYLRIGPTLGFADSRFTDTGFTDGSIYISACEDLAKQEWSAKAKLVDSPNNKKLGITLTDGQGQDPFTCAENLRVFNYWLYDLPSRAVDVTFVAGSTAVEGFPLYGSYGYEPLPESGDGIVSRQTKIVACNDDQVIFQGDDWVEKHHDLYYQGAVKMGSTAGSQVQFSWYGDAIYWRAVADKDGGQADVYLDNKFQQTVDCYFAETLPFQFAFIRTGLARKKHTIRIVIRADKNPSSSGTVIRHMAFEFAAESYKASAGFSSVMGKNNWFYHEGEGTDHLPLSFLYAVKNEEAAKSGKEKFDYPNCWGTAESCLVGNNYQIPGQRDAVRSWIAPHAGKIRVEGTIALAKRVGEKEAILILKNDRIVWPTQAMKLAGSVSHDLRLKIRKGDAIHFIARSIQGVETGKVIWDPTVTFIQ